MVRRVGVIVLMIGLPVVSWFACSPFSASNDDAPEGGADTSTNGDGATLDAGDAGNASDGGRRRVLFVDNFDDGSCGVWGATPQGGNVDTVSPGRGGSGSACRLCRTALGDLRVGRGYYGLDGGAGTYQLEFYARDQDGGDGGGSSTFSLYTSVDGGQVNAGSSRVPLTDWTPIRSTAVSSTDVKSAYGELVSYAALGDCILFDDVTLSYIPP